MTRYFIEIAYQGTAYNGLQVQNNATSVQGIIDNALSVVLNDPLKTVCASRTDKGVHARQNYLHFDTPILIDKITHYNINNVLPADIQIKRFIKVAEDAHSRFDATSRSYEYHIHFIKNPFLEKLSHRYRYGKLDIIKMNEAAEILLLQNDFTSFCRPKTDVKTKVCNITYAKWKPEEKLFLGERGCIVFYITADRFLRGMVRAIVGTLIKVGKGEMNKKEFEEVIKNKDQQMADFSPPPQGLYLVNIAYPYIENGK